jgi:hypothetical protein
MNEGQAFELVQMYINGWKRSDLEMITSGLDENCVIIESHGPVYYGIRKIELWFKFWLEAKSTVLKWDISSFTFCETNLTAFCEWDFACISNEIEFAILGISFIKFSNHKITFIHEYRMTQPMYEWNEDKLEFE